MQNPVTIFGNLGFGTDFREPEKRVDFVSRTGLALTVGLSLASHMGTIFVKDPVNNYHLPAPCAGGRVGEKGGF